jgi:hypothetical protein
MAAVPSLRGDAATEGGGPAFGREFADAPLRVGRDAQQDIASRSEGLDINQPAALDQRVQQGGPLAPFEAAGEEPVLPPQGHNAQLILSPVVVDT